MARINELDVLVYLNKYLKEEYPAYFREFGNGKSKETFELMSCVNIIYSDLESKSIEHDAIIGGNANSEIDVLIDKYARENLSDTRDKCILLAKHVKGVIQNNNQLGDNEKFIEELSMKVAVTIYDDTDLISGRYDAEIFNEYLLKRESIKKKNYDRIKTLVFSSGKNIGFDESTINKIFNDIADLMIKNYPREYADREIEYIFIASSKMLTEKVIKRVRKVIEKMVNPFTILDYEVIPIICHQAMITGEISAVEIINGQKDDYIRKIAESKRVNEIPESKVLRHIYNVLVNESDEDIISSELSDFASIVMSTLTTPEFGFTSQDIVEGKCDEVIKKLYLQRYHPAPVEEEKIMRGQSVKTELTKDNKVVDYAKYAAMKKLIQQTVCKALVALVLGGALGVAASYYVNYRKDEESISIVQSMDDTYYKTHNSDEYLKKKYYSEMATGIIDYYNELKSYGDEYVYLCFYNAYSSGLKMDEMNSLLSYVRKNVSQNEDANGLEVLVNGRDCYYDYMYYSLVEMGCPEIQDGKYLDALISYKQSYYGFLYGIASDFHMYSDDRINLEQMVKLYEKYNRKYLIELGDKIKNTETDSFASTGPGRGV